MCVCAFVFVCVLGIGLINRKKGDDRRKWKFVFLRVYDCLCVCLCVYVCLYVCVWNEEEK